MPQDLFTITLTAEEAETIRGFVGEILDDLNLLSYERTALGSVYNQINEQDN